MTTYPIYTIGEALIDFIPKTNGQALADVDAFERQAGGAPANVAAAVAKLGGKSTFLGQVGRDAFGEHLLETLRDAGVETKHVKTTKEAPTALAFVSLKKDGERDFTFFRNPSADMLYGAKDLPKDVLKKGILHFCSVSLIDAPIKDAHVKAIETMKAKGGLISFDPNVRLPLFKSEKACLAAIRPFLKQADLLKVAEDELHFITGKPRKQNAIKALFNEGIEGLIITKGKDGAEWWNKVGLLAECEGETVDVVDTTGAGDAFIGAILHQLSHENLDLANIDEQKAENMLAFANHVAAHTTTKKGAIRAFPSQKDIKNHTKER